MAFPTSNFMQDVVTEQGLKYEAPPPISVEFQAEFDRIVPICPNNQDKYLKYSWGNDRLEFCNGQWSPRYGDTSDPPKYLGRCGWVLEGWQSPDVYDKADWLANESLLGPWPLNGVWDFIEFHEDENGHYLPLDNSALERVRSWKFWKSKGHKRSLEKLLEFRCLRYELQEKRRREAAKRVAQDFGKEFVRTLERVPESRPAFSLPSPTKGFLRTESGILVKNTL